jgi:hypothetical protein
VTLLKIIVFLFVPDLPEDGRKRPKHVGGLNMFVGYIIVSNYSVVVGIYMMIFLTARKMCNFEQGEDLFKCLNLSLKRDGFYVLYFIILPPAFHVNKSYILPT